MYLHNYNASTEGLTTSKVLTRNNLVAETIKAVKAVGSTFVSNTSDTPSSATLSRVYIANNRPTIRKGLLPQFEKFIDYVAVSDRNSRTLYLQIEDLDEMVNALIHVRGELKALKEIYEDRAKSAISTSVEDEMDDDDDYDDDDDDF